MKLLSPLRQALCRWHARYLFAVLALCDSPHALAQAEKLKENFTFWQTTLASVAVTILTAMIIYAGVEVSSGRRKIMDVWPIIAGGSLIASAAGYAAYMVGK